MRLASCVSDTVGKLAPATATTTATAIVDADAAVDASKLLLSS